MCTPTLLGYPANAWALGGGLLATEKREVAAVDGSGLSDHERRVLDEMEASLRGDAGPGRRARTACRICGWRLRAMCCRARAWAVLALGLVVLSLLVIGIRTAAPGVIWAFAFVWPLGLFTALRLMSRRTKR